MKNNIKNIQIVSCTRCNQILNTNEKHVCIDVIQKEWKEKKLSMLKNDNLPLNIINW